MTRRPPLTVCWAAALLAGPPAFQWAVSGDNDRPSRPGVGAMAVGGGLAAGGLLGGRRWGFWAGGLTALVYAGAAGSWGWEHRGLIGGPARVVLLLPTAILAVLFATSATLLWWPETRRWCGLLPARREDD